MARARCTARLLALSRQAKAQTRASQAPQAAPFASAIICKGSKSKGSCAAPRRPRRPLTAEAAASCSSSIAARPYSSGHPKSSSAPPPSAKQYPAGATGKQKDTKSPAPAMPSGTSGQKRSSGDRSSARGVSGQNCSVGMSFSGGLSNKSGMLTVRRMLASSKHWHSRNVRRTDSCQSVKSKLGNSDATREDNVGDDPSLLAMPTSCSSLWTAVGATLPLQDSLSLRSQGAWPDGAVLQRLNGGADGGSLPSASSGTSRNVFLTMRS
mmetsp:Transcript_5855/g.16991  ORF Transcript_5855/g.16991 Transcript_5855/m.16991 type:complete len:267 (-) Transcript_5855:141-941(-)